MGELLIQLRDKGPDPLLRDGDVVSAFSADQILSVNASSICHVRHCSCNSDGLRPRGGLPECYEQHTRRYRYERIRSDALERTDLISGEVTVISSSPNTGGDHCHVAEYFARRVKHAHHWIFGTAGHEVCYGGGRRGLDCDVTGLWTEIEQASPYRRVDHVRYPFRAELRNCLAIWCGSLTDDECGDALAEDFGESQAQDLDDNGNPVEAVCCRSHAVDWRGLAMAPETDLLNPRIAIDVRDQLQVFSDICLHKKGAH